MNHRIILLLLAGLSVSSIALGDTLTVAEAVRMAYAVHPAVNAAASEVRAASGERLSELSPPPPSLSTEYEGVPRRSGLSAYSERRAAVGQEIDFPLKYVWRASALNAGVKATSQLAIASLLNLEVDVRSAYNDLWAIDAKIEILARNVEAAELYAFQLERKVELGEAVPLEARRARVEALQAKAELDAIQRERAAARVRLARLIGGDTSRVVVESPLDAKRSNDESSGDDLSGNPELNAARFNLERAASEKTFAQMSWLPDLEVSYFRQKVPVDPAPDYWGVEAGLSLPVWFWLGGRGEIQRATAQERRAASDLAALQLETTTENVRLIQTIEALRERYRLYRNEVMPLAKEAYELSLRAYRLGEANYLQVLDAQRSSLAVQIEFTDLGAELYGNLIQLDRLAGRSLIGREKLQKLLSKGY